jgi:hypothetical protein
MSLDTQSPSLLWALDVDAQLVHASAATHGGQYRCPCCRRHVHAEHTAFVHQQQDCDLRLRPVWSTNTVLPFGDKTTHRRCFMSTLLRAQWNRLHIQCASCGQGSPLLPCGEIKTGFTWRGLRLDIAVLSDDNIIGALLFADTSDEAYQVAQRVHGMHGIDACTFRVFVYAVDNGLDVSPLLSHSEPSSKLSLAALQIGSEIEQPGGCETPSSCCSACHLVRHSEPQERSRLEEGFYEEFCRLYSPYAITHSPPKRVAASTPAIHEPPATSAVGPRRANLNTTIIRNTVYGNIPVVIRGLDWHRLTAEQQLQAIEWWWTGANVPQGPSVLGLWCLNCAPCTTRCFDTLANRVAPIGPLLDGMQELHEFDHNMMQYGPKAGISRRQRLQRHLRIHNVSPSVHTAAQCMILECDTIGLHLYS